MKTIARIDWRSAYSVGNDYIDGQHKQLIDIVNTFFEAMKSGKAQTMVYPILNRLVSYAERHFVDEEAAMELAGCPKSMIDEHKKVHEKLVQDIFEVTDRVISSKDSSAESLSSLGELLSTWLLDHILNCDMEYAPYVKNLKFPQGK